MARGIPVDPLDFGAELTALLQTANLTPDEIIRRLRRAGHSIGRSSLYDWMKSRHLPEDADVLLAVVHVCIAAADRNDIGLNSAQCADEHWENLLARAKQIRDSRTSRRIHGTINPLPAMAVTHSLPTDIASFTGRRAQMKRVMLGLSERAMSGSVVRIDAIDGMAGIGKTAFAVHVAHRLAGRFPDGQIFLRLHGHTPGQQPVKPADALASLLLTTGIDAQQIPPEQGARADLWRNRIAGRKILMVLDDATGSDQVQSLLPGTAQALVLVTSRRRLTALTEALPITLESLKPHEAAELFVRLSLRAGLLPNDEGVVEVARLCGHLPLAISLMAGQLKHHDAWTTRDLAADLASATDRLAHMRAEDLSVAAAFDLSFRDITPEQQRLFRQLGLHPGIDIDAYATAALGDTDLDTAHTRLDDLYSQHLIDEPARGRYQFHDLIREHARALAAKGEPLEREAAMNRLLDYYLCAAITAGQQIDPRFTKEIPTRCLNVLLPELSTRKLAVAWMTTERLNLHEATAYAARHTRSSHATVFAAAMFRFLHAQGHWEQAMDLDRIALNSAREMGDQHQEAEVLAQLGVMQYLTGDCLTANENFKRALQLYRDLDDRRGEASTLAHLVGIYNPVGTYAEALADQSLILQIYGELGDRIGQADALLSLGLTRATLGQYPVAVEDEQQALQLYRELGDREGEANALNNLSWLLMMTGDHAAAITSMEEALQLYRDLNLKQGEANILIDISTLQRLTGNHSAAVTSQERSLHLYRKLGDRHGEANALNNLGAAQQANGDHRAARQSIEQALHLHRSLGSGIGLAQALNNLGVLLLASATHVEAHPHHEQALVIARDLATPREEAQALEGIGQCHLHSGRPGQAGTVLRQAMAIYERMGSPDAQRVAVILLDHGI